MRPALVEWVNSGSQYLPKAFKNKQGYEVADAAVPKDGAGIRAAFFEDLNEQIWETVQGIPEMLAKYRPYVVIVRSGQGRPNNQNEYRPLPYTSATLSAGGFWGKEDTVFEIKWH